MIRFALSLLLSLSAAAVPSVAQTYVKDEATLRLSGRAERHIREGHFLGGRNTRGKSVFSSDVDLLELLKAAENAKPKRERNGRLKRVVDAGKEIGKDGWTGKPMRTYVVISESDGQVVTMYPGR